jgi:hypothetical protein
VQAQALPSAREMQVCFEKTRIEYLGVIISHDKVEMDPVKIAGVADWPMPSNKKEMQSFISFVNFY